MKNELPKGWVKVNFEDCIDIPKGLFKKIPQKRYLEEGKFPIVDQGIEFIAGYTNDGKELFNGELPVIIFGDHTRTFKFVDFNFAIGADGTKILKAKKGINPKYLFYYLKSIELPSRGYSRHYRYLRENNILLAPENEQHRIVSKIEELSEKLNKAKQELKKILPLIKKFRQSVLAKAFKGELTEQDSNDEPAKVLLERIRQKRKKLLGKKYKEPEPIDKSDLPELPEGWEWVSVKDLTSIIRGVSYPKEQSNKQYGVGLVPILRAGNIQENLIFEDLVYVPSEFVNEEQYIGKGDIVVAMSSGSRDIVGKAAQLKSDWDGSFGAFCAVLRPTENIDAKYLGFYFLTREYRAKISELSAGININNLRRSYIENLILPLPPLNEQHHIVQKIEQLFAYADSIEKKVKIAQERCDKLTQSILAKAFHGELVPRNPNDQPASELLKCIAEERKKLES